VLAPDYPITTERLMLQPPTLDDVDSMLSYQSREDVCRYIPYEPRTREQVVERVEGPLRRTTLDAEGQALWLVARLRPSRGTVGTAGTVGALIGDVMLMWHSEQHRSGEIGYVFAPEHAGRGYATEAARALLGLGFDGLRLHRITARIDARNTASVRVAQRLGMRQEARLVENEWFKGGWSDELDFAMLDREWHEIARLATPTARQGDR
jgi:RimJ/RimL family protein N-acetyltransferase